MSQTYQSRVFTFVNSRTHQLKDTCAKGWRHLKVAVVWSGQILLYPLHILAQTTKIFQPQISSPPPPATFAEPTPNINIEQALEAIELAGSAIAIANPAPLTVDDWSFVDHKPWNAFGSQEISPSPRRASHVTTSKPTIRGLSSLLTNRQLVLVTTENQILDILTIPQQQEIRRRIGLDLATSWHQWHTGKLSGGQPKTLSSQQQLSLTSETAKLPELPPPNLVDRLSTWFQQLTTKPQSKHPSIQPEIITSVAAISAQKYQLSPSQYPFTPQPPKFERFLELPQLPPIKETQPPPNPDRSLRSNSIDLITKLQPDWLKQLWNHYRDYVYIPAVDDSGNAIADLNLIVHQLEEFQLIPIEPIHTKIISKKPTKNQSRLEQTRANISTVDRQNIEHHQDWIETAAESIGYSQSPLAKLLAWFDRLMLRIENWSISLWHRIANILKLYKHD